MRTGVRTTLALFFCLATSSPLTYAAVWDVKPTLRLFAGYNGNVSLQDANENGSPEGRFFAATKFSLKMPQSGVSGDIAVNILRFSKETSRDRNNVRTGLNTFYNMESSTIGLNGSFTRDSTLDSQLDETVTGFVDIERSDKGAGAFWRYNFGPRTNVGFNYNYRDVTYEDIAVSRFVDFNTHSGSVSMTRRTGPRSTLTGSVSYSQSENSNEVTTVNASVEAGGSLEFSETLTASISLGRRKTTQEFRAGRSIPIFFGPGTTDTFIFVSEDISNEGKGITFDINITKDFERGSTSLSADQAISTSVNGSPIEVTNLKWATHYGFTTTVSGDLVLRVTRSESQNVLDITSVRKSFNFGPKISWEFSESLSVSAIYSLNKYAFDNGGNSAAQNAAYLTLTYQ